MRLRDLISIARQHVDFLDLAAWAIVRVAHRIERDGPDTDGKVFPRFAEWVQQHPAETREILRSVRDEFRDNCKRRRGLRTAIREVLGR